MYEVLNNQKYHTLALLRMAADFVEEEKLPIALEVCAEAEAALVKYHEQWQPLCTEALRELATRLVADVSRLFAETILTGEKVVNLPLDTALSDDECLIVLQLIRNQYGYAREAELYVDPPGSDGMRKVVFRFTLGPSETQPRHVEAARLAEVSKADPADPDAPTTRVARIRIVAQEK